MIKPILYAVEITQDAFTPNPRIDFDPIGTLYTWHRNYVLGGDTDYNNRERYDNIKQFIWDWVMSDSNKYEEFFYYWDYIDGTPCYPNQEELEQPALEIFNEKYDAWIKENVVILPVYLYDHSGTTVRCEPFSCPWDSGQIGFIYITKDKCEKEKIPFDQAEGILRSEIKTLNQYLTGDVWHWKIHTLDTCLDEEEYDEIAADLESSADEILTLNNNFSVYLFYSLKDSNTINDYNWIFLDSCGGFYGYEYAKQQILELCAYHTQTEIALNTIEEAV